MKQKSHSSNRRIAGSIVLLILALMLSACIAAAPDGSTAPVEETPTAIPEPEPAAKPVNVDESAPQGPRSFPVQIRIPDLRLDLPVTPMGWDVAVVDNAETTTWIVPEDSLGWQVNSAGPGGSGNMLITGHQTLGDALLAPLALDEIVPGQEILVTDATGSSFLYQISEVSDPLPVAGASEDEDAQAAAYANLDGDARLTLVTGWPDFTTTHRVFAVAEFIGKAE